VSAIWDTKSVKTTPIAADEVLIIDTVDSRNQKRSTLSNIKKVPSDTTSGITAFAGGGQASAVLLSSNINEIATVATTGDSVKLLSAVAGLDVTVINNGANALDVFPNTGDQINALAVNVALSLAAGSSLIFKAYNATNWVTF